MSNISINAEVVGHGVGCLDELPFMFEQAEKTIEGLQMTDEFGERLMPGYFLSVFFSKSRESKKEVTEFDDFFTAPKVQVEFYVYRFDDVVERNRMAGKLDKSVIFP